MDKIWYGGILVWKKGGREGAQCLRAALMSFESMPLLKRFAIHSTPPPTRVQPRHNQALDRQTPTLVNQLCLTLELRWEPNGCILAI